MKKWLRLIFVSVKEQLALDCLTNSYSKPPQSYRQIKTFVLIRHASASHTTCFFVLQEEMYASALHRVQLIIIHISLVLIPNNRSNLHFSAASFVMETTARKYSRVPNKFWGDRSQRKGAVADFMPCILLSSVANLQSRPAWRNVCDLSQFLPRLNHKLKGLSCFYAWKLRTFHNLVYFHTNLIQREPNKAKKGGSSIWVWHPWLVLRC